MAIQVALPGGTKLHVDVHQPPADAVPTLPILALHGALSDARQNWRVVAPLLAKKHPFFAPDQRGHGLSDDPAPFTLAALVDDALAVLDALGAPKAHLLGCSLGGYVALALRARAPERVASVALAGVKVGWHDVDVASRQAGFRPEAIAAEYPLWVPFLEKSHAGPDQWRVLASRVAAFLATLPDEPALSLEALAADPLPLFYALGDRDGLVPLAEVVTIRQTRPTAPILVVPRAGHLFREYNPETFCSAYLEFTRRVETGRL